MRKIVSKTEIERSSRKKQLIAGGVMAFVMLISVLGYAFQVNLGGGQNSGQTNITKFNGNLMAYVNGFWNLQIGNTTYTFSTDPRQTYSFSSVVNSIQSYSGKIVYVYSENSLAEAEIARNFYLANSIVRDACPENQTNCGSQLPIKTCSDNFIIIKDSNQTGITTDRGCIYINGQDENLANLTDGFLLKAIGA